MEGYPYMQQHCETYQFPEGAEKGDAGAMHPATAYFQGLMPQPTLAGHGFSYGPTVATGATIAGAGGLGNVQLVQANGMLPLVTPVDAYSANSYVVAGGQHYVNHLAPVINAGQPMVEGVYQQPNYHTNVPTASVSYDAAVARLPAESLSGPFDSVLMPHDPSQSLTMVYSTGPLITDPAPPQAEPVPMMNAAPGSTASHGIYQEPVNSGYSGTLPGTGYFQDAAKSLNDPFQTASIVCVQQKEPVGLHPTPSMQSTSLGYAEVPPTSTEKPMDEEGGPQPVDEFPAVPVEEHAPVPGADPAVELAKETPTQAVETAVQLAAPVVMESTREPLYASIPLEEATTKCNSQSEDVVANDDGQSELVANGTSSPEPTIVDTLAASEDNPATERKDSTVKMSIPTPAKKRRRRIVEPVDADDSDEEDRLELPSSPTEVSPKRMEQCAKQESEGEAAANRAASILQNVVMIQASTGEEAHKRRKIRVLDSEDESDEADDGRARDRGQRAVDNVDDIGLMGENDYDEDERTATGLLVDENADGTDLDAMEGIEIGQAEQIVTIEAPIVDQSRMEDDDEEGDDEQEGREIEAIEENGNVKEKDGAERIARSSELEGDSQPDATESHVPVDDPKQTEGKQVETDVDQSIVPPLQDEDTLHNLDGEDFPKQQLDDSGSDDYPDLIEPESILPSDVEEDVPNVADDENDDNEDEEAEEEEEDEQQEEEDDEVEEGVEMISEQHDDGEAIGIATDDEQELQRQEDDANETEDTEDQQPVEDEERLAVDNNFAREDSLERQISDDRGNENDDTELQSVDVEEKKATASRTHSSQSQPTVEDASSVKRANSGSEMDNSDRESENDPSKISENGGRATPAREVSKPKLRKRRKIKVKKWSSDSDDVVCQNDVEMNTISLLTDEEDSNPAPLPTPKMELPVVRIVDVKKELLDEKTATRNDFNDRRKTNERIKVDHERKAKKKKKERPSFDNSNPFGMWSTTSSEEEYIPNDIYFGTPDRVFTLSTKLRCLKQREFTSERYTKPNRSGRRRYSSESDTESRRRRQQKLQQIATLKLPAYQQQQLQNLVKRKRMKRDRLYDRSQDIPNEIYFGNVNVPLHILHSLATSSSEDDVWSGSKSSGTYWKSTKQNNRQTTSSLSSSVTSGSIANKGNSRQYTSSQADNRKRSTAASAATANPNNDRSVQAMKEYLKIAGFKNVKFFKLWEGCKTNQERANAILRLMQEKGLEGEPTIAKCRELRKQLQMKQEADVLDTSVIIDSGQGRTTRQSTKQTMAASVSLNDLIVNATTAQHPATSVATTTAPSPANLVPLESLETLNRIRGVIDPDSEGE